VAIGNAAVDETYALDALPLAGESLVGELRFRDVGGKGANVATIIARCGVEARLVAMIGDDERAAFVRGRLLAEPLEADLVTRPGSPTDLSLVYATADGDNAIVTTVATTRALGLSRAVAALENATPGDLVVLQGNLPRETTLGIIEAANARALPIALNPSPAFAWFREALPLVDAVFVNDGEARTLVGERDEQAVRALLATGVRRVVLTRGASGALLGRAEVAAPDAVTAVAAAPGSAIDTTGAGDTFMGVALASAARRGVGLDERALRHAARAAAITIGRHGALAAFPDRAALAALLASE